MNKKNQFIQFGLGMLGYKSKRDLIENLFIKSINDTYNRIDKNIGIENEIRDRFINKDYSENESYAAMMGFVIEGDIKSICSTLEAMCKKESFCESDFVNSKINDAENSFITSHNRKGIDVINIYHLFFEFNLK